MLVARAQAIARPKPESVLDVLNQQEAVARAAPVRNATAPVTIDVRALKAAEKTARSATAAMSAEIDTVNERIAELIAHQHRRKGLLWRRWFPDLDVTAALARLRDLRERLRASHSLGAHARLRAEIAAKHGASDRVRLDAEAARERDAARALAESRLAILKRARTLLARVPALAYVGARNLLRMATRIERAREHGWDPGPTPGHSA